jgi:hypothetical protein
MREVDRLCLFFIDFYVPSLSLSHVATDGQSVSQFWCRAPSRAHDQMLAGVLA